MTSRSCFQQKPGQDLSDLDRFDFRDEGGVSNTGNLGCEGPCGWLGWKWLLSGQIITTKPPTSPEKWWFNKGTSPKSR